MTKKRTKLVDDVHGFLMESSKSVGNFEADSFDIDMWNRCLELPIESPIEQLLYIAFHALLKMNFLEETQPHETPSHETYLQGTSLEPQVEIGSYRVDFLAFHRQFHISDETRFVIECDSQEWHERTEEERRYEKQRDRFLISKGYKLLHFTGKEIKDNPFKVASEILSHLTGQEAKEFMNENFVDEKYID